MFVIAVLAGTSAAEAALQPTRGPICLRKQSDAADWIHDGCATLLVTCVDREEARVCTSKDDHGPTARSAWCPFDLRPGRKPRQHGRSHWGTGGVEGIGHNALLVLAFLTDTAACLIYGT